MIHKKSILLPQSGDHLPKMAWNNPAQFTPFLGIFLDGTLDSTPQKAETMRLRWSIFHTACSDATSCATGATQFD